MGDSGRKERNLAPTETDSKPIKSSCSLFGIVSVLLVILVIISLLLIFFRVKNIDLPGFEWRFWQKQETQADNSLTQQINGLTPGDEVSIKITEAVLGELLKINDPKFPVKKASVKINTDKILLSGKTGNSFLATSVDVGLVPKPSGGKLFFEINEIKAAGVPVPKRINQVVTDGLTSFLTISFPDFEVTGSELSSGYLAITGIRK